MGYVDGRERYGMWWLVPIAALVFVAGIFFFGRSSGGDEKGAVRAPGGTTTTAPPMDDVATCRARDRFIVASAGLTPERDPGSVVQSLDEIASALEVLESDTEHPELAAHVAVLQPAVEEGRRLAAGTSSPEEIAALADEPGLASAEVTDASVAIANYPLRCPPAG